MTDRPIPERLAKAGIRRVADNLPAGAGLSIVPSEFLRWFRPEIEARGLSGRVAAPAAASVSRLPR